MPKGLKVAVIGARNWGKNLVRNFQALGALGAVAEIDPNRRTKLAEEYPGIQVYGDCRDIWESKFPAVVIATPAATHYELAKAAILAGKDVFVEKPMTLTASETDALIRLAEQEGRILMVGHLLLYQPAVRFIAESLRERNLGRVLSFYQEHLNSRCSRASLSHRRISGHCRSNGPVCAVAVHEDDVSVHLRFPGGEKAHLHVS